jgi:hypothetical protein
MPDALEIRPAYEEKHVQPSVSMKGCWQVVCVPGVYSVEIGLARQQTLADELTSQSAMAFRACRTFDRLITRQRTIDLHKAAIN